MILIREISPETLSLLNRIYRSSKKHQVRQRAQFFILLHQGYKIPQLSTIFSVTKATLYNWINGWEQCGILGLYDKPGRGRKSTFTSEQEEQIYEWVQASPIQLNKVLAQIKEAWGITISKKTLKRIIKRLGMSWHRFRRIPAGRPLEAEYQEKKQELEELERRDAAGEISLYYMDESGFGLIPCIPYGWQPISQYVHLLSCMGKRLNVLGFLRKNLDFEVYVSEQTINSDVVINCIDTFFSDHSEPVFIVADNASIHTSNSMYFKSQEWAERGIHIFYLPTYSPHLNLIEKLWKFMKYYWIEIDAYKCWSSLVEYVERVLNGIGGEYKINFV